MSYRGPFVNSRRSAALLGALATALELTADVLWGDKPIGNITLADVLSPLVAATATGVLTLLAVLIVEAVKYRETRSAQVNAVTHLLADSANDLEQLVVLTAPLVTPTTDAVGEFRRIGVLLSRQAGMGAAQVAFFDARYPSTLSDTAPQRFDRWSTGAMADAQRRLRDAMAGLPPDIAITQAERLKGSFLDVIKAFASWRIAALESILLLEGDQRLEHRKDSIHRALTTRGLEVQSAREALTRTSDTIRRAGGARESPRERLREQ